MLRVFLFIFIRKISRMNTKLTLNIDNIVIGQAKLYAKQQQVSLSKLVESYFTYLTQEQSTERPITPLVKSLSGIIDLKNNETDDKEIYRTAIQEKHL